MAVGSRRASLGPDASCSTPFAAATREVAIAEQAVPHIGLFEVVWALAAGYWAALLVAAIAIFLASRRVAALRPTRGDARANATAPSTPRTRPTRASLRRPGQR